MPPAPGQVLEAKERGAAHVLVERSLAADRKLPREAIRFIAGQHTRTGREPVGSDLEGRTLKQLLSWALPRTRPDLCVVLRDADERPTRRDELRRIVSEVSALIRPQTIVAVAVQEFEAWLIGDLAAVRLVAEVDVSEPRARESMGRREAKEWLGDVLSRSPRRDAPRLLRRELAERLDLEKVARACPSFAALRSELASAP